MEIINTVLIEPLVNGLALFYRLVGGNMGLGIIVFTVALRLVLTPLTRPYMESMKKMKKYQKDIDKLKKKYKDEPMKLRQAQADFFREKGINPGAGCLPYLLQIVVLIALFRVFTSILVPGEDVTAKFNERLYPALQFQEGAKINTHFLYLDVSNPDKFDVSGIPFSLPGPILILAALVQFLSAKLSMPYLEEEKEVAEKTKDAKDDMQVALQSSMIYTFPLMTLLIGLNFPSGLALYWVTFSVFQFIQQYRSQGWGGLTPLIKRVGLLQLPGDGPGKSKK